MRTDDKNPVRICRYRALILAATALSLAIVNSDAQTKYTANTFVDADEVADTAGGGGDAWQNWYGTAYYNASWDASDASNNVASGSLMVEAIFPDAGIGGQFGPQFHAINGFNGYTNTTYPAGIPGNGNGTIGISVATNVDFDIRFDPTSAYDTNGNVWPWIEVGTRGTGTSPLAWDFGYASFSHNNTNWFHRSFAIGANASWSVIPNIYFKHYDGSPIGYVKFYIDNIRFTFADPQVAPTNLPSLTEEKAKLSLRMLAGNSQYDRIQVASVDTNQSWVGGTYPVSYKFTIIGCETNTSLNEFHVFLIPLNFTTAGAIDQYTDYATASNNLRLQITGGAAGTTTVFANIGWKTNLLNQNPTNVALNITNEGIAGTWTLTFSNATSGALIAPGTNPPAAFSLPADVAATFANPLVAYFGVQPNASTAIGQYIDLTQIQTIGVASPGVAINSLFNNSADIDTNVWRTASVSQDATDLVVIRTNSAFWLSWLAPDYGAGLATSGNLSAPTNNWKTPLYYTSYATNTIVKKLIGIRNWVLLPKTALPTVDSLSNGVPAANGFFRLQWPAPAE